MYKQIKLSKKFQDDLQDAIKQVNLSVGPRSRKKDRIKLYAEKANQMVAKINEGETKRQEGSQILEDLMDRAREGQVDLGEIRAYIESIIQTRSLEAMTAIINLKDSDQTYTHCIDVGILFQDLYFKIIRSRSRKNKFKSRKKALLSAFLHDFGKAQIPKEIIDSKTRFSHDSPEMEMIRKHPLLGARLLSKMDMSATVINMSLYHHVKLDNTLNRSYPTGYSYQKSDFETRLLSIIDVYQALVGNRCYKKSWTQPKAMKYLLALSGIEFSSKVFAAFQQIKGLYPVGSLVKLSDGSLAFVVHTSQSPKYAERPKLVLIRNQAGEDLEQHPLIDLRFEEELKIIEDLDANEIFQDEALTKFSQLNIVT